MVSLTAGSGPVLAVFTPDSSSPAMVTSWPLFSLSPPLSVVVTDGAEPSASAALVAFSRTGGSKMGVGSDMLQRIQRLLPG